MIATIALLTQAASNLPADASALERSISALESCISALDNSAETFSKSSVSLEPLSWLFTALVVVGVAMEFWVIRDTHREDVETWAVTFFGVSRTVRPPTRRLVVEYISVALVVGGIIGELVIGVRIASINVQLLGIDTQLRAKNGELRSKSDQLVKLVTLQAGSAAQSAKTAKGLADAEAAELKILNPRLITIGIAAQEFIKAASPYHGQDVNVKICGDGERRDEIMEEQRDTQKLIAYILEDKAGWTGKFDRMLTHESDWKACNSLFGILVWVGPSAPAKTTRAAKALSRELTRILPKQQYPMFSVEQPDHADQASGWALLDFDPRIVVVVIGERPIPLPKNLAKTRTPNQR